MICIFNGRSGFDKNEGKATTTRGTVIDYMIGSPYLLNIAKNFCIHEFDPLYSDMHCKVSVEFSGMTAVYEIEERQDESCDSDEEIGGWEDDKIREYVASIDRDVISSLIEEADLLSVQELSNRCGSLIISAARRAFGTRKRKAKRKRRVGKPKTKFRW